jgi:hypothetical protein
VVRLQNGDQLVLLDAVAAVLVEQMEAERDLLHGTTRDSDATHAHSDLHGARNARTFCSCVAPVKLFRPSITSRMLMHCVSESS